MNTETTIIGIALSGDRNALIDLDNIDFAHYGCNAQKQDRTLEEYREWRERVA
nr:MAG TPA: restriction endonuclease [Caudoviricetes sp.]